MFRTRRGVMVARKWRVLSNPRLSWEYQRRLTHHTGEEWGARLGVGRGVFRLFDSGSFVGPVDKISHSLGLESFGGLWVGAHTQ